MFITWIPFGCVALGAFLATSAFAADPLPTPPVDPPVATPEPPVAPPTPATAPPEHPSTTTQAPAPPSATPSRPSYGDYDHPDAEDYHGVPLHGFASMQFALDDQAVASRRRGYARGFALDNVVLYLAPDLGARVRFLTEIALEPGFDDQAAGIDLERLQIGYVFGNLLTAQVGRFHTPLGYHITAYHHGAHLMTAVEKPEYLDFEDHKGVLPVHTVGLWLMGQVNVGSHRFGYMGWFGNGDSMTSNGNVTTLDPNMIHDDNRDWTVGGRLLWSFGGALRGLSAGLTAMTQRVDYVPDTAATSPNVKAPFRARLVTGIAHVVYDAHGVEFANEFHFFDDNTAFVDGTPSTTVQSWAGYSQLAYWIKGVLAPFARVERGYFDVRDAFFFAQINGLSYSKVAAGIRYNINDRLCLKLEGSHKEIDSSSPNVASGSINTVRSQAAVRF